MATMSAADLEIRPAGPDDWSAVVPILRRALNKLDDPNYEDFLDWKHRQNPFGVSPGWVALHDQRIIGYRTMLRWRFLRPDGRPLTAVRAVDTATDPDYQGLGIFRTLTLKAVAELTAAGNGLVFNTPNDKSRPGYLKMGWQVLRRVPVGVLPAGPRALARMLASRTPAQLWSEPTEVGLPATALQESELAQGLLEYAPRRGLRTDRDQAYLVWRTAFGPLNYRVLTVAADPAAGGLIFRLRRRGAALEAAIVELLVPNRRTGIRLVRRLLHETGADYAIAVRSQLATALPPLPRQGPLLTGRPLAASVPPASSWVLTLGDIELF